MKIDSLSIVCVLLRLTLGVSTVLASQNDSVIDGDRGFEVLRTVVSQQLKYGVRPIELYGAVRSSSYFTYDVRENHETKKRAMRLAIRESCPVEFTNKVFRELFHDRSLGNSWPHKNDYDGFLERSLSSFFEGYYNSRVDSCLGSVAAYCEAGGVYGTAPDYILRLELDDAENKRFYSQESVTKLAKACPLKLKGSVSQFQRITDLSGKSVFLKNVRAVELTLENIVHLNVANFTMVTDLHLIVEKDHGLEHYEKLSRLINMENMSSIKISVAEDLRATDTMITGPSLLLSNAHNLESFELSYSPGESMETLIDAFPSNLKHVLFVKQDLTVEELASLNGFFRRTSSTLESLALPRSFYNSGYPTLPKNLKSLSLLDARGVHDNSLPGQLKNMTRLEKLDASVGLYYNDFYDSVPKTVKKLEVHDNSAEVSLNKFSRLLKQIDSLTFRKSYFPVPSRSLDIVFQHKNIKHLAFRDCEFWTFDFGIKNDTSIETLVIENNEKHFVMQDERFVNLQGSLNKMPRLEKFSLIKYKTNVNWNLVPRIIESLLDQKELKLVDIYQVCFDRSGKPMRMFDRELEQLWRGRKDLIVVGH